MATFPRRLSSILPFLFLLSISLLSATDTTLPRSQVCHETIGMKVWRNECDGTVEGLTSWNRGEDFPSLGIGHFIWYPEGKPGPFEESFPPMIAYLKERGVSLPKWLTPPLAPCPWPNRQAFMAELGGTRLTQLRKLLAATVAQQSDYLFERLSLSQTKLCEGLTDADAARLRLNFQLLSASTLGTYALVDYVNFKGEGTKPTERYQGHGWGLRQVLLAMKPTNSSTSAPRLFAQAAAAVLKQRVTLSPLKRNERQYLPGWLNRTATYGER